MRDDGQRDHGSLSIVMWHGEIERVFMRDQPLERLQGS